MIIYLKKYIFKKQHFLKPRTAYWDFEKDYLPIVPAKKNIFWIFKETVIREITFVITKTLQSNFYSIFIVKPWNFIKWIFLQRTGKNIIIDNTFLLIIFNIQESGVVMQEC